jgi:hypothetical protein
LHGDKTSGYCVYVNTYRYIFIHACTHKDLEALKNRDRTSGWCMHASMYVHAHIHTYMHTYIHTYMCMHACIHTYILAHTEGHNLLLEALKRRKDVGVVRVCNHVYGALLKKRHEQEAAAVEEKKHAEEEKEKAKMVAEVRSCLFSWVCLMYACIYVYLSVKCMSVCVLC